MISLRNHLVFVTGASSGIGRATALAFAGLGARLLLCGRRADRLEAVAREAREGHAVEVHTITLDVRHRAAVDAALSALPEAWQSVDILVNNAGLSRGLGKVYEDDPGNWDEMIDTNISGLLSVTRAIVPGMIARNRGHVINLGSIAGHITYPNGAVYCATKAAEKAISEGLKLDLVGTPIRVTSVDPGMVETEFSAVRFRGDAARAAKVYENVTPLTAEDVADSIVWAATRPAHINIHTIVLTTIDQGNAYVLNRRS